MITLSLLADLEMKSEYDNTDVGRVPVAQPGTYKHQVTSKPKLHWYEVICNFICHARANFPSPFGATTKLPLQILISYCSFAVRSDLLCYELI